MHLCVCGRINSRCSPSYSPCTTSDLDKFVFFGFYLHVSVFVCVCGSVSVFVCVSLCLSMCLFCSVCGSVSVHDLVTPLALFSSPGNRATITNYRSRAVRPNTIAIPITRQFSRRGKMMSGGLSIRWQLAWLPHHI